MAAEFQSGLDDIAREAGVDEIKRSVEDMTSYDPKAALDNIAGIDRDLDDGEFDLDDDDDRKKGNTILDPAVQSQAFVDDPDALLPDDEADNAEPPETEGTRAANQDDPPPTTAPASSGRG